MVLTKDTAFLFAYRAIAYERFAKEVQLRTADIQRMADCGRPFFIQAAIQMNMATVIAGLRIGMRDLDLWKDQFDARLMSGARDDFHFVAVRFDQVLPVVACGAFHPQFDFQGKPLQQLGRDGVENLEHITLTVTTFEAQTVLVFGWIGSKDGPAKKLAESYVALNNTRKSDALVRLVFIHTDNLFLRPSWWKTLPETDRRILNELMRSGTTTHMRTGNEMTDDATSFLSAEVIEIVRG